MIFGNTVLTDIGSLRAAPAIQIREPSAVDGAAIWQMINETGSLDKNSLYCNLLQCTHFSATCAVAEMDGVIVGWLSGYVPPDRDDTLFVWQVCVSAEARGQGVARKLIGAVLERASSRGIRYIDCTITEDNTASWALFGSVARTLNAQMQQTEHFLGDVHFGGSHDSELAVSIGPFDQDMVAALSA